MKLKDIIVNCNLLEIKGEKNVDIDKVSFDSREVAPGTLFFAVRGTQTDGHAYIESALDKGASVVICEKMPETLREGVTYIRVDDSSYVLGVAENYSYYQCPNCGEKHEIYGPSRVAEIAEKYGIAHTARIPIDPKLAAGADKGLIELYEGGWLDDMADACEKMLES